MAGESTEEIWTVVVGCTSADIRMHNLRLHRFRVDAASGRVLGRSGDLLHRLRHVAPADDEAELFPDARAALISRDDDQRRLYLFCDRWRLIPGSGWDSSQVATPVSTPTVAMALDLADKTLPTIFALDLPPSSCALSWPVPAAGNIWAPYVAPIPGGRSRSRLTMLHLDETSDDDSHQWIDAGSIDLPQEDSSSSTSGYYSSIYGGYAISGKTPLLQGYAVLGDVILVSLRTCNFYLFRCSTCHWSRVYIVGDCCHYIPLNGRAVFSEEDDHIYFFRDSCLYAYKVSLEEGKMTPPIKLASLYDDYNAHGNGFLAGLSNRVLCVAWIGMDLTCGCTTRHLLATTLRVIGSRDDHGEFVPTSTQVLHSTWRNVDMLSTEAQDHGSFDRFCFLQEFGEDDLWLEEDANDAVDSSSQVSLPCCRTFPKGSLEK